MYPCMPSNMTRFSFQLLKLLPVPGFMMLVVRIVIGRQRRQNMLLIERTAFYLQIFLHKYKSCPFFTAFVLVQKKKRINLVNVQLMYTSDNHAVNPWVSQICDYKPRISFQSRLKSRGQW